MNVFSDQHLRAPLRELARYAGNLMKTSGRSVQSSGKPSNYRIARASSRPHKLTSYAVVYVETTDNPSNATKVAPNCKITVVTWLNRQQMIKLPAAKCAWKSHTRWWSARMLKYPETFSESKRRTSRSLTELSSHFIHFIALDAKRPVVGENSSPFDLLEDTHRRRKKPFSSRAL